VEGAPTQPTSPPRARVVAPAIGARELIEASGTATFLEDRGLRAAQIDYDAMELWFSRKPSAVFLYTELAIYDFEPKDRVRCRRLPLERNSVLLNAITVVAWQRGDRRMHLELNQTGVKVAIEEREHGVWEPRSVRTLPMEAVGWNSAHIRYAEDARHYEVACVPALRTVSCDGTSRDQLGHCLDRELVVRPWRAPFVPHVGPVHPAYHDPIPEVPSGSCDATCEPSACDEAMRMHGIPWAPLYAATAPVIAAFRTEAACRTYASTRKPVVDDRAW
jgi:hypothetical protein